MTETHATMHQELLLLASISQIGKQGDIKYNEAALARRSSYARLL